MENDSQNQKEIPLELLYRYKQIISTYITAQQEARREKILFLLSLNDVWKKMPPELSIEVKQELLLSIIDRYFKESNSSLKILASSIKDVLSGEILEYKRKLENFEEQIQKMQQETAEAVNNYEIIIKSADEKISFLQSNNDILKDEHDNMIEEKHNMIKHIVDGIENTNFWGSYKTVLDTFLEKYHK